MFHCDCVLSLIRGSTTSLVNWSSLSVLGRREKSTTSKLLREHVILNYYVPHSSEKNKGSPYTITESRVPELIPVLGSQPAGDASHKSGGRLPLLSARYSNRICVVGNVCNIVLITDKLHFYQMLSQLVTTEQSYGKN